MRFPAIALMLLLLPSCSRVNPAFADTDGEKSETSEGGSEVTSGQPTTSGSSASTRGTDDTSPTSSEEDGTGSDDSPTSSSSTSGVDECAEELGPACDPFAQDCPEGKKCSPTGTSTTWEGNNCVPLEQSPRQLGDSCTVRCAMLSGLDDCDAGLICVSGDENGDGVCTELCHGSQQAPLCDDPTSNCALFNDETVGLCGDCDPFTQDCGHPSLSCIPFEQSTLCLPAGEALPGEPCEFVNACQASSVCIAASFFEDCLSSGACCAPLCDTDLQNCAPQEQCDPFFVVAPFGLETLGVCVFAG